MSNGDIIGKAYSKICSEYERLNIQPDHIARFGLKPGWNVVIGVRGCCGIAMSFGGNNPRYADPETNFDPSELQPYIGMSLIDFAKKHLKDPIIRRRSMTVAALNALSQPLVSDQVMKAKGYDTAIDLPRLISLDDVIAIVGYGGLVKEYMGRCKELHVTDQRPISSFVTTIIGETIERWPDCIRVHTEKENRGVLSHADVVFITGSTLVNGTFDEVIRHAKNARLRCLYGSSAQIIPDVLFENGIDVVMSVAITDPRQFEQDVRYAPDMEGALKSRQRKYTVSCISRGTAGTHHFLRS
ncbi:MAG TPA: DUF364 domain-containing protein [Methanocella sp.]|nr:DUF364 domain-containing protein [Methanocella sp.]